MQTVVRLRIRNENTFMGKGVREVLDAIDRLGSIKKASISTGISYPKIMRMLHTFEKELGFPAVASKKGGSHHGGSQLTEKGRAVLECFREIENDVETYAQKLVHEKFQIKESVIYD